MKRIRSMFSRTKPDAALGSDGKLALPGGASAPAGSSPEEFQRLSRAVEELTFLNELAREIGASLNSKEVMEKIIRRSLRAVSAEQAVITILDQKSMDPMKTYVRMMVTSVERQQYHFEQNLLGWMQINRRALVVNNPRTDERFKGVKWEKSIISLVCVPLMIKADLKGVLTVYNKRNNRSFTEDDQRLLSIIAAQSAQVIENARLYEEEKALFGMREELKLAAQIQLDLLPKNPPQILEYDIAGRSIPAQMVGGDYYDFIEAEDNKWAMCLGDVSGKGLPASLLMANLQATLRGQAMLCTSPKECLRRSNKLLFHSTDPEKFATLFCGILDVEKHKFTFSNAGHEPPILLDASGSARRLQTGGMVLGVSEKFPYEEETAALNPGDLLVVYSDGIIDAVNQGDEPFGEERLLEIVSKNKDVAVDKLIDIVVAAIKKHAGEAPQIDDITLVAFKRTGK